MPIAVSRATRTSSRSATSPRRMTPAKMSWLTALDAAMRGGLRGHGEEAHEQVREAGHAEDQRDPERHGVDRVVEEQAGLEVALALRRGRPRGRGARPG
jgi:hypothetical protein